MSHDCPEEELQNFVATKDQHIPQCEFCPQNLRWHTALGELKENLPKPVFDIVEIKEEQLDQYRKPNPLYL